MMRTPWLSGPLQSTEDAPHGDPMGRSMHRVPVRHASASAGTALRSREETTRSKLYGMAYGVEGC